MRNFVIFVGALLLTFACKSTDAARTDTPATEPPPATDLSKTAPNERPETKRPIQKPTKENPKNTPKVENTSQKNYKLSWATAVLDRTNKLTVSWKIAPTLPTGSQIHIFKLDDSTQEKTKLTKVTDKETAEITQGFTFPSSPNYRNSIGTILLEFSHAETPLNLPAEKVSVGYDYQTAWGIRRPSPNYVPKIDMNCHPTGQEPSAVPLSCDKFSTFFTKASLRKEDQTYFVQRQNPNNFPIVYYLHKSAKDYRQYFEEVIDYYNDVAEKLKITTPGKPFIKLSEEILQGDTKIYTDKNSIEIGATSSKIFLGEAFTSPNRIEEPTSGYLYKGEIVDADIKIDQKYIDDTSLQVYFRKTPTELFSNTQLTKLTSDIFKRTFSHELMHTLGVDHNFEHKPYCSIMGNYKISEDHIDAVDFNYELNEQAGEDYDLQTLRYLYTDYYEKNPQEFEALTFKVLRKEPK